jgi:hypothetical protein
MEQTRSLREILDEFKMLDSDMPPEEFDPEKLIGDVKDKVDAIKYRLDSWQAEVEQIKSHWINPLLARIKSIEGKHEKLKAYVKMQMDASGFDKLPGHMFTATIKKNPPSVKYLVPHVTEDIALDFSNYIDVEQRIEYSWRKDLIKEHLKAGEILPFARIEQGTRVDFVAKKGTE